MNNRFRQMPLVAACGAASDSSGCAASDSLSELSEAWETINLNKLFRDNIKLSPWCFQFSMMISKHLHSPFLFSHFFQPFFHLNVQFLPLLISSCFFLHILTWSCSPFFFISISSSAHFLSLIEIPLFWNLLFV